jgi:hypothetical protein
LDRGLNLGNQRTFSGDSWMEKDYAMLSTSAHDDAIGVIFSPGDDQFLLSPTAGLPALHEY